MTIPYNVRVAFLGLTLALATLGGCSEDQDEGGGNVHYVDGGCESTLFEGEGTYYDADGSGNCSFPASPADMDVAAMNNADYGNSEVCGACAAVKGPAGTVTVRIVDRCPECASGDLDLSPQAFSQIAEMSAGRVPIQWRFVPCDVTGPIVYHFKEGSNQWWTAVQIRNHRNAVEKVEFLAEDGRFKTVNRESYNYFVEQSGMGSGPYTFKVTDILGNQIEQTDIQFEEGGEVPGNAQFPGCE